MQKRIYSFALLSRRGIMAAMRLQPIIVPGWKTPDPNTGNPAGRTPCRTRYGAAAGLGTAVLRRMDRRRGGRSGQGPQSGAADRAQPGLPGLRRAAGAAARQGGGRPAGGPADVERADVPDCLRGFAPIPRTSLPFQSVVVASDNDPYCRLERARLSPNTGAAAWWSCRARPHQRRQRTGRLASGPETAGRATPALVVAGLAAARAHLAGTRAPLVAPGLSISTRHSPIRASAPDGRFHWGHKTPRRKGAWRVDRPRYRGSR